MDLTEYEYYDADTDIYLQKGEYIESIYISFQDLNLDDLILQSYIIEFLFSDTLETDVDVGISALLANIIFKQKIISDETEYYYPLAFFLTLNRLTHIKNVHIKCSSALYIKFTNERPSTDEFEKGRATHQFNIMTKYVMATCYADNAPEYISISNVCVCDQEVDFTLLYSCYNDSTYCALIKFGEDVNASEVVVNMENQCPMDIIIRAIV